MSRSSEYEDMVARVIQDCITLEMSTNEITSYLEHIQRQIQGRRGTIGSYSVPITSLHLDYFHHPTGRKKIKIAVKGYLRTKTFKTDELDNMECNICLDNYVKGCEVAFISCGHYYHTECITKWLLKGSDKTCPLCRMKPSVTFSPDSDIPLLLD